MLAAHLHCKNRRKELPEVERSDTEKDKLVSESRGLRNCLSNVWEYGGEGQSASSGEK